MYKGGTSGGGAVFMLAEGGEERQNEASGKAAGAPCPIGRGAKPGGRDSEFCITLKHQL